MNEPKLVIECTFCGVKYPIKLTSCECCGNKEFRVISE